MSDWAVGSLVGPTAVTHTALTARTDVDGVQMMAGLTLLGLLAGIGGFTARRRRKEDPHE